MGGGAYSEHQKLTVVKDRSQAIGEFLEWLGTANRLVCDCPETKHNSTLQFQPVRVSTEKLLAEYFGIDLDRIESEKRDMLARIRESTKEG